MGGHNFQALRVHQNAKLRIASAWKAKADVPRWYNIVGTITPSQTLVRPQPRQHPLIYSRLQKVAGGDQVQIVETQAPRRKVRTKKASRIFQPVEIRYEEDELRKEFFKHHPWELARPRILLENDGKDYLKNNWKSMQQSHRSLDGESVIQRQLWLLHNIPNMTKGEAYDQARREFYQLRMREDIERRVAREEAEAYGAYWGKSNLEVGMELEDKEYNRWLDWAGKEVYKLGQLRLSGSGIQDAEEEEQAAEGEQASSGPDAPGP